MRYLITENKLMETMDKFFEKKFPEIELPLIRKKSIGRGNRGYGSSFDDYTYINYYYYSDHDHDDPLFIRWDDNDTHSNEKWTLNEKFELMYDFFGEENFENFIIWKFELDITTRGNKLHNWRF